MSSDANLAPALKAAVLSAALPYMRRHAGRTVVVKYGGHAMEDSAGGQSFAHDVVLLKQVGIHPVVVHGGGPQIGEMLRRLGIESRFVDGLRVTDAATMEIVEMVLAGTINKSIVAAVNSAGGRAVGLCGKDGGLIRAKKLLRDGVDLGFVGEPEAIDGRILDTFKASDIVPVIAPVGVGAAGETYNINSDTVAGAIAAALKATRLLLLTDVAGVLDAEKRLIPELSAAAARRMIAEGTIYGGMIPKVETCLEAVEGGVEAAVIVDGRVPHAILLELFSEGGAGTLIRSG